MESLSPHVVVVAKLPILNLNEFDLWKMRIEQYFLMTDYSLWEVILNGDSPTPTRVVNGIVQAIAPTIADQRLAIEKRFGGNKETKKVQKTLLKQQYENFSGSSSKSLDQIHDRLQKLISQLEIFEQSLDDLFNNLKIYEAEVKRSSSTSPTTQNIAFVSSQNTDITNESVSVVASVSGANIKVPVSALPNVDNLSDAEMDLKWQMAMLTMRARIFLLRTGRNLGANGTTSIGFDMQRNKDTQRRNVPVLTSTSNALVSRCDGVGSNSEVAPCSKACSKAYATLQSHYDKLTNDLKKSQFDVLSYKKGLESVEARLVVYQQNENVFEEDIKLLKLDVMLRDNAQVELRKKFEKAEKERDDTFDSDELLSSETNESVSTSPVHDRYNLEEGYHVVPPPYTGTFMPPKPDLVFHDAPTVSETVPNVLNVEPSTTKPNKEMYQSNRPSTPIIEDWASDLEDKSEGEPMPTQKAPSFIQTSKHMKTPRTSVKPVEHPTPAENIRKDIPKSRVLTKSRLVPLNVVRPVTTDVPQTNVIRPRPPKHGANGNWVWKPKCTALDHVSRHTSASMTLKQFNYTDALGRSKNISYLSDFEEINRGYVAFGGNPKGGKITSKGKISTGKLDFDDIYFVKELKFNLFSISQMCDKKNNVLFTDTECVVLSSDFKMPDENHVLLRVPRENNMYNIDLKNIVPLGDLTCLFAKATLDESNLWHRRLGHINFKTMNKLVKGNLVRGLPSKVFENNHTCVACKKGKQHRASYKTKPVSSVSQPLQKLHIDLFRPTFVKSLNKKSYCLVVTDDYSRVLVTKPHNKTPYELLLGRIPSIGFMRPFRCPVTILNTLYPLEKFDRKADEGFLNTDADATFNVKEPEYEVYVSSVSSDKTKKHDEKTKREAKGKSPVDLSTGVRNFSEEFEDFSSNSTNGVNAASAPINVVEPNSTNSTNSFNAVGSSINVVSSTFEIGGKSLFVDPSQYPDDPNMPALEDITYSDDEEDVEEPKRVHQALKDPSWIEAIQEELLQFKMQKVWEEGIDYEEVFTPVARIKAIRLFLAYASFMGCMVYQMDVKSAFLYGTIEEEVYVCQPPRFEDPDHLDKVYKVIKALYGLHQALRAWYETLANYLLENGFQIGKIDQTLFIKKQKRNILLVQAYVDYIIFGSTNKELCKAFEKLMKEKF
nr:ribonuclease H-like domain-containing protein [Tanacetum cinerariifolium]